eukprot:14005133-Alexandrium_andersonii.AAC.1
MSTPLSPPASAGTHGRPAQAGHHPDAAGPLSWPPRSGTRSMQTARQESRGCRMRSEHRNIRSAA